MTIRSASIAIGTRRAAAKKVAGRFTATVDLRGLPRGRFAVKITVKTVSGKTLKASRRYRTCTAKRRG